MQCASHHVHEYIGCHLSILLILQESRHTDSIMRLLNPKAVEHSILFNGPHMAWHFIKGLSGATASDEKMLGKNSIPADCFLASLFF